MSISTSSLDLTGSDKLNQLNVFSDIFHKSCFGMFLSRSDGSFVLANRRLSSKLNIPEMAFMDLTVHDLVVPKGPSEGVEFTAEEHRSWYERWFKWPTELTLESRSKAPFKIWGFIDPKFSGIDSGLSERVPHNCLVIIQPVYVRRVGKMIVVSKEDDYKNLLAFGSIIFLDDFLSFSSGRD